ncbi:MAG: hypothetical protein KAT90_10325 [Gammaproteobacteria bacterium]|nr:hypothetical protein [Gammaproteobacteria bacterium]
MNPNRKPISVKIQASDVEKFGVPKEWVGNVVDLFSTEWSEYTGRLADTINSSVFTSKENVKKGREARDARQIVGLDPMVKRVPVVERVVLKKDNKKLASARASFLYKKAETCCISGLPTIE